MAMSGRNDFKRVIISAVTAISALAAQFGPVAAVAEAAATESGTSTFCDTFDSYSTADDVGAKWTLSSPDNISVVDVDTKSLQTKPEDVLVGQDEVDDKKNKALKMTSASKNSITKTFASITDNVISVEMSLKTTGGFNVFLTYNNNTEIKVAGVNSSRQVGYYPSKDSRTMTVSGITLPAEEYKRLKITVDRQSKKLKLTSTNLSKEFDISYDLGNITDVSIETLDTLQTATYIDEIKVVGEWPTKEGPDKDNLEKHKERFEKENPDFEVIPDNWSFDLKTFYAKAAGGNLPNIFGSHFTEFGQIVDAGYAADLTDALKDAGLYDNYNKDVLKLISRDGKVYAFPFSTYALGMACNVDMMEAAGLMEADGTPKQPKDWNEVAEFAVKIKEATGKPGLVFPSAANNGGWIFTPVAWSFGVDFMEQDKDGKWKATFDTPEAVEALQFIKDLKWKYDVLPANTLIDGTEYYKVFGTGGAGMMISATAVANNVLQYGMDINSIGMMAMPAGPKNHVTLMGGSIWTVSSKSNEKQIKGAIEWMSESITPFLNDKIKESKERSIKTQLEQNKLVGIKEMSIWNTDAEGLKYSNDLIEANANININHVKLYNDFIADLGDCELRPEEPVCAQELYSILDGCIQEVLINKDADCKALLKKACSDFQQNYLDHVDY